MLKKLASRQPNQLLPLNNALSNRSGIFGLLADVFKLYSRYSDIAAYLPRKGI